MSITLPPACSFCELQLMDEMHDLKRFFRYGMVLNFKRVPDIVCQDMSRQYFADTKC